jgi:hypothetical protein
VLDPILKLNQLDLEPGKLRFIELVLNLFGRPVMVAQFLRLVFSKFNQLRFDAAGLRLL